VFDGRSENEIWSAIAAFEQILEVEPNDTSALDALTQAYELVGDGERARGHLLRLARAYIAQGNAAPAANLIERLERYGAEDVEAAALIREIQRLPSASVAYGDGRQPGAPAANEPAEPAIDGELALAWRLHSAGLLTPEEYAGVVNDLSEIAARRERLTLSVLHVLHDRGFPKLDQIIGYMARESRAPMVPVTSFETPESCHTLLPMDFMARRGVAPFAMIAQEALVAVLNPFDEALRERVIKEAGRPCHFYLTWPTEFDAWIQHVSRSLDPTKKT
jgi:tetratricopeptide (TPR) repeat protein